MKMNLDSAANTLIKATGRPRFIYGTAWKKKETQRLVQEAINNGFTAIDTAAQPRHYQEPLVGAAIRDALKSGTIKRDQLYIQTKYTTPAGQDPNNMPYDAALPLEEQIRTSVTSSFRNLRPADDASSENDTYLDCLLLHSPLRTPQLTISAWKVLETYVPSRIRALGISNVSLPMLQAVYENASVKPSVVQNRFYPETGYDWPLRQFCNSKGIAYQSFWTLTGNPNLLASRPVAEVAKGADVSPAVALYALVMSLGVTVLNGTTSEKNMRADLEGIMKVEEWSRTNEKAWEDIQMRFRGLTGERTRGNA
jgi:diketogulonate reductase-like aldo/keto reductase